MRRVLKFRLATIAIAMVALVAAEGSAACCGGRGRIFGGRFAARRAARCEARCETGGARPTGCSSCGRARGCSSCSGGSCGVPDATSDAAPPPPIEAAPAEPAV